MFERYLWAMTSEGSTAASENVKVVQGGERVSIDFHLSSGELHNMVSMSNLRLLFVPVMTESPKLIEHAALKSTRFDISQNMMKHVTELEKCGMNHRLKVYRRNLFALDTHFYMDNRRGKLHSIARRFVRKLQAGNLYMDRDEDLDLGRLYLSECNVITTAAGSSIVGVSIDVPVELDALDPLYYFAQIFIVSDGVSGLHKLVKKSFTQLRARSTNLENQVLFPPPSRKLQLRVHDIGNEIIFMMRLSNPVQPRFFTYDTTRDADGISVLVSAILSTGYASSIGLNYYRKDGMYHLVIVVEAGKRMHDRAFTHIMNSGPLFPENIWNPMDCRVESTYDRSTADVIIKFSAVTIY